MGPLLGSWRRCGDHWREGQLGPLGRVGPLLGSWGRCGDHRQRSAKRARRRVAPPCWAAGGSVVTIGSALGSVPDSAWDRCWAAGVLHRQSADLFFRTHCGVGQGRARRGPATVAPALAKAATAIDEPRPDMRSIRQNIAKCPFSLCAVDTGTAARALKPALPARAPANRHQHQCYRHRQYARHTSNIARATAAAARGPHAHAAAASGRLAARASRGRSGWRRWRTRGW